MTELATPGTVPGLTQEIIDPPPRRILSHWEEEDCRAELNGSGIAVSLIGMHDSGRYDDDVVIMRSSECQRVQTVWRDTVRRLASLAYRHEPQKNLVEKGLPFSGMDIARIEKALACIKGWRGKLPHTDRTMTDMTGLSAEQVRDFIRTHVLPHWRIGTRDNHLPEYNSEKFNERFLLMLEEAYGSLETDLVDFFSLWCHLDSRTGKTPFAISPGKPS